MHIRKPQVHHRLLKSSPLNPMLGHLPHSSEVHCIIILAYTNRPPKWFLQMIFSDQNFTRISQSPKHTVCAVHLVIISLNTFESKEQLIHNENLYCVRSTVQCVLVLCCFIFLGSHISLLSYHDTSSIYAIPRGMYLFSDRHVGHSSIKSFTYALKIINLGTALKFNPVSL
jgi:hypothetical protein